MICLSSTDCIHCILASRVEGQGMPSRYLFCLAWPFVFKLSDRSSLGSGNASCRWFGPPGHALVWTSHTSQPICRCESHLSAFPAESWTSRRWHLAQAAGPKGLLPAIEVVFLHLGSGSVPELVNFVRFACMVV